jgi:hypothetical protein
VMWPQAKRRSVQAGYAATMQPIPTSEPARELVEA